jgi:hypothetical protein
MQIVSRRPRLYGTNGAEGHLSRDDPWRAQIHVSEPVRGARQARGGDQSRAEPGAH